MKYFLFQIDKEKTKTKVGRKKMKKHENSFNVDEKELTIAILDALKKQPVLWDIKDRSHDKVIRQNGFQEVAQEVSDKLQIQIKWEDVRKRITDIRYEYSREYDKQVKGERYELPWYTEHMQYLKENIEVLIKHRVSRHKSFIIKDHYLSFKMKIDKFVYVLFYFYTVSKEEI